MNWEPGEEGDFLRWDRFPIVEARFSRGGKWVAFTMASRPHARISVAPAGDTADTSWIELTADDVSSSSPAWSADGNRIYFLQQCQGSRCIWARRFDPRHGQPAGEPFPVRHFHHARWSLLPGADPQNVGLVAARDKL